MEVSVKLDNDDKNYYYIIRKLTRYIGIKYDINVSSALRAPFIDVYYFDGLITKLR